MIDQDPTLKTGETPKDRSLYADCIRFYIYTIHRTLKLLIANSTQNRSLSEKGENQTMYIDGIRRRLRNIERHICPGEARIIVTVDGIRQEVTVSEYLDHRSEWVYQDSIGDYFHGDFCVPPFYFIMLKMCDDDIRKKLSSGSDQNDPQIIKWTKDREKWLHDIAVLGGLV